MSRKKWVFERWRKEVFEMVKSVGRSFRQPGDDWLPVLIMDGRDGRLVLDLHEVMRDRNTKLMLPHVVVGAFTKARPMIAATVLSAWSVGIPSEDQGNPLAELSVEMVAEFGASSHPERQEVLLVEVADSRGRNETWMAPINRRENKPPTLGAWVLQEDAKGGMFNSLLGRSFRLVREGGGG